MPPRPMPSPGDAPSTPTLDRLAWLSAAGLAAGLAGLAAGDPTTGGAVFSAVAAAPAGWLQRVASPFRTSTKRSARSRSAAGGVAFPTEVLDAVPDAFLLVNAEGQIEAANAAVQATLGHAQNAIVGSGLADALTAPADRDAVRTALQRCVESGAAQAGPRIAAVHADGSEVAVELSIRYASGGLFGVTLQVPRESAASEAALAAAEGRHRVLRTVVDAVPAAVVAVDRSGHVVLRNRASARALGPDVPANAPLPDADWRAADAVMRSGTPSYDHEEPDAAGGVRVTTRIPVRDRAGAIAGLVAISRDVTDQKAAESQLLEDKKNAEAAARSNGEFLATTSHEIRTLMSGVTGMTTLLSGTDLDDEQQSFVDTIETSSEALLTVINDILDFSKIEAGMLAIEDQPYDIRRVLASATGMVAQQADAKGLDLSYDVADDVPETVHGDAGRVRQVLVNLLSNALKFTDEGAVRLRVESVDGRPALQFSVEDTGVGIAPDRLEAVFERFEQADDSTARTHGGTGLGLSICRRLVQMMGGEMTAESVPGEGSVFRFTVATQADAPPTAEAPAVEAPPAPAEPARPDRAVVMSTDAILPSARVLIAEDNPVVQRVTLLSLRRLGYRPDVVGNGKKAVEAVRRTAYDVVLMDIMMPVMGGLEATREILADPGAHPAPLIVALTANAMEGDRQRCLDAGCDEYLAKPVAPRYLAATIEEAMRRRNEAVPA